MFKQENGKYGYPRLTLLLNNIGVKVNKHQVYESMKRLNIISNLRLKKMNRKPKEKKIQNKDYQNIPKRQWYKFKRNELWVTDVSYFPLNGGFAYLSVIKDVYSGFIVGYNVSLKNDNKIYIDTWKEAIQHKKQFEKIIIHSDNGFQYTSNWAKGFCKKNNLIISLSRPGCSLDNAACETFFSQIKCETPKILKQKSFDDLKNLIFKYIEYYNYSRLSLKHNSTPFEAYYSSEIKKPTSDNLLGSQMLK